MALFDYKNYDSATSAELVRVSYELARATSFPSLGNIDSAPIAEALFDAIGQGALTGSVIDLGLPDGWSEVSAADLGLPPEIVDIMGMIKIESPVSGWTETGPQVKIYEECDANGQVVGLCVSYAATNSPVDVLDYFVLQSGELIPMMEPVLNAVRAYAEAHGLTGKDVLITGYSLGSGMTNIMSQVADTLVGGFYAESDYIGHDGPMMDETTGRVLNVGWENDVVYGVLGDNPTILDALNASDPVLVAPDYDLTSSADNLVLFDGAYASDLWPFGQFSLINVVGGWYGHVAGILTDGIERIIDSEFYELTERDSVVVVSEIGADRRGSTWVWDKPAPNHERFFSPSMVIGTDFDDLLKDNTENDYLEGRTGDDTMRVTDGNNRVSGGEGTDTLRLEGYHSDWVVYRMADGTLFVDKTDGSSLNEVTGVEMVEFEGLSLGGSSLINWLYSVQGDRLEDEHWSMFELGDNDVGYSAAVEGTAGNDELSGQAVFGRAGNDVLSGTQGQDVLHGGQGDDVLHGGAGDRLYGAEGDDRLIAEEGGVVMNGGWGDDVFVLQPGLTSEVIIRDFDALATGDDVVELSAAQFGDADQVLENLSQVGDDVVLDAGGAQIRFAHTQLDHFAADDFVFV